MYTWKWRTEEERDKAIEDDSIEETSPQIKYVHPEGVMQCIWESSKPEDEVLIAKCPHYERDWEWDKGEDLYCCCTKFWGTGFGGLCEMAVVIESDKKEEENDTK